MCTCVARHVSMTLKTLVALQIKVIDCTPSFLREFLINIYFIVKSSFRICQRFHFSPSLAFCVKEAKNKMYWTKTSVATQLQLTLKTYTKRCGIMRTTVQPKLYWTWFPTPLKRYGFDSCQTINKAIVAIGMRYKMKQWKPHTLNHFIH